MPTRDRLTGGTTIGGYLAYHKGNLLAADIEALGITSLANLDQIKDLGDAGFVKIDTSGNLSTSGSNTIATGSGGTGLTSYTSGDILYASADNVLSKLAKGTDGQVLKLASGFPSWGTDNNDNDIDYVSAVSYSGGNLTFTATGNGFAGDVDISGVNTDNNDYISSGSLSGGTLTLSYSGTNTLSDITVDLSGLLDDTTIPDTNYYLSAVDPSTLSSVSFTITGGTDITGKDFRSSLGDSTDKGNTTTNEITTAAYNFGTSIDTSTLATIEYNTTTNSLDFIIV